MLVEEVLSTLRFLELVLMLVEEVLSTLRFLQLVLMLVEEVLSTLRFLQLVLMLVEEVLSTLRFLQLVSMLNENHRETLAYLKLADFRQSVAIRIDENPRSSLELLPLLADFDRPPVRCAPDFPVSFQPLSALKTHLPN